MTNDTPLESSYSLLLESEKNCNFQNLSFFCKIQLCKILQIKFPKNEKNIHFLKALDHAIQLCKYFCKILNNLMRTKEKRKISFHGLYANNAHGIQYGY